MSATPGFTDGLTLRLGRFVTRRPWVTIVATPLLALGARLPVIPFSRRRRSDMTLRQFLTVTAEIGDRDVRPVCPGAGIEERSPEVATELRAVLSTGDRGACSVRSAGGVN